MKNQKGAVLLTTLMLGIVALVVVAALLAFILHGEKTSIPERKYTTGLEAAKGVADYVMKGLMDNVLICTDSTASCQCKCNELESSPVLRCPTCLAAAEPQTKIVIDPTYSNLGDYTLEAEILSKTQSGTSEIYGIRVTATNQNSQEKAVIEFVFKLNY